MCREVGLRGREATIFEVPSRFRLPHSYSRPLYFWGFCIDVWPFIWLQFCDFYPCSHLRGVLVESTERSAPHRRPRCLTQRCSRGHRDSRYPRSQPLFLRYWITDTLELHLTSPVYPTLFFHFSNFCHPVLVPSLLILKKYIIFLLPIFPGIKYGSVVFRRSVSFVVVTVVEGEKKICLCYAD